METIRSKYKSLDKTSVLLDVRTDEEFREGHIPNSINISHDVLIAQADVHAPNLNKYKDIYLYCRSGKRAQMAVQMIGSMIHANIHLVSDGGMMTWAENGYEME